MVSSYYDRCFSLFPLSLQQTGKKFLKGLLFGGAFSAATPFISKGFDAVASKLSNLKSILKPTTCRN